MVGKRKVAAKDAPFAGDKQQVEKLKAMSAAALASQKLRDNYKDFTDEMIDVVLCPDSGRTLRQQLVKDIEDWQSGRFVIFGPHYHVRLREAYDKDDNTMKCL